ncbi:MAG TPA: hypothetical protein V6D05_00640 [Stenomitos sp.]
MIAESPDYQGAFAEIEAAERAYQRLREEGFSDEHMSLHVNEECPACLADQARSRDAWTERLITGGQLLGGVAGLGFGAAMVWWPLPSAQHLGWVEGLVQLCVVASWLLTGAILGSMVGAVASELRPGRPHTAHRHFILMLSPPLGREEEALAILHHTKATIERRSAAHP